MKTIVYAAMTSLLFLGCAFAQDSNKVLLQRVSVNNGPLPGQNSRASQNFDLRPSADTKNLLFEVEGAANEAEKTNIRFALAQDVRFNPDYNLLENLSHGTSSAKKEGGQLYIRAVAGASKPFTVLIYATK